MEGLASIIERLAVGLSNLKSPELPRALQAAPAAGPDGFVIGTALAFGAAGPPAGEAVTVPLDTFSKHCILTGASGCGKTTTGHRLRDAFVGAGMSVVDVDYRGDGFDRALARLAAGTPPERLTLIDYRRSDRITPFNWLGHGLGSPESRAAVVYGAVRDCSDGWGVLIAMDLRMALGSLAESRGSLLDVPRLLLPEGEGERRRRIAETADEYLRESLEAYDRLTPEVQRTREAAVRNKLDPILGTSATLRLSLGMPGAPDMRRIMDEPGHVTLVALGADRNPAAVLVGRTLIAAVQRTAMARVDVPEEERNPVRLICDEAQNLLGEETCQILAEGRRFRLGLVAMCQFARQLIPELQASVRVNCATQMQFQTSSDEAGAFAAEAVSDLPAGEVKRLIQSAPVGTAVALRRGQPATLVRTPDSPDPATDRHAVRELLEEALARTTVPRADAEALLARRQARKETEEEEVVHERKPFTKRAPK